MLYAFDLDSTLIYGYMHQMDYAMVIAIENRPAKLAELRKEGHSIGIVSNQGGIAFGYNSEEDFQVKITKALHALDLPLNTPVKVCFHHPKASITKYADPEGCTRRKPSGAMIRELMTELGYTASDTMFVGDRPEDEQAAADAGVAFMWERDFFGPVAQG